MDDDKLGEKNMQIIPDFFYEFISRIIPGLVVIGLSCYWSGGDFKFISSVGLSLFALVIAWIIGITLDIGVFVLVAFGRLFLSRFVSRRLLKKIGISIKDKDTANNANDLEIETWERINRIGTWERNAYHKQRAVKIFFRNMASICLLMMVLLFCPNLNSLLPALHKHLDSLFRHKYFYVTFGIIFFLIFASCWKSQNDSLESWLNHFKKRNVTEPQPKQNPSPVGATYSENVAPTELLKN